MLYNDTSAASCHREARDRDLHVACRDGDILSSWDSQTWHVHVAVLPRRHPRRRHQG